MSIDDVKAKVQRILSDKLGSVRIDNDGDFVLQNGSSVGFVKVRSWGDDETIVKVWSPILSKVKPSPQLYKWVATSGQERFFAHVRIIEGDSNQVMIILEHDLLGDYLDPDELMNTVLSVMLGADEWDDELQKMFGGERASD